jgi:hypothetical protein
MNLCASFMLWLLTNSFAYFSGNSFLGMAYCLLCTISGNFYPEAAFSLIDIVLGYFIPGWPSTLLWDIPGDCHPEMVVTASN